MYKNLLLLLLLLLLSQTAQAEAISSPRVFTRGSFVYLVEPQRIAFLSMDVRSSHILYNAPDSLFFITSAVRSGDVIWAANNMGAVIAIDMQTTGIEEFGRGRVGSEGGQIDIDRRYLWLASRDTLYRMDLTSREWVPLPIPNNDAKIRGVMSFNDQVHIITANDVRIFNPITGDWVVIPHKNFALHAGEFYRINEMGVFVQNRALHRYNPSKRLWEKGAVKQPIRAVNLTQDLLFAATESRIYRFNPSNLVAEMQPVFPQLRNIRAFTNYHGRHIGVTERGIITNTAPFNFDITPFPEEINATGDIFAFSYHDHIILYAGNNFIFHQPQRRLWSRVRIINRGEVRREQYMWDENGAHISLTDDIQPTINGALTLRQHPSGTFTQDDGLTLDLGEPLGNATITVRTETPEGRTLDITIDNGITTLPPQKGFYYRGADGDILNRASFGVQPSGIAAGQITPSILTEGASASFESKRLTDNRDRSFMTASAGSGHILSKTEWRSFGYHHNGIYHIGGVGETREVVASSIKMYVDGIPLPGTDFAYEAHTRNVRLLRRDKTNPTSHIQISFSERIFHSNRATFELFPESHFGQYNFVEGAISPRSWLSARTGLLTQSLETYSSTSWETTEPTVFASIPVEMRGASGNRSFLLHPEIAYNNKIGAHSAGVMMGARENRAFASYRGLWAGRDFNSLDRYTFNYHDLNDEHEASVGYDLFDNFRASWHQTHRRTVHDNLSHFELRTSYIGDLLPDVEFSASSRIFENTTGASNRSNKETFVLRLSNPSSRILGAANHFHNVGYDFAWTEYQESQGGHDRSGRIAYGAANVSPISQLTFTSSYMYRLNPIGYHARTEINPYLAVYAHDLPPGVNAAAAYAVYTAKDANDGSTYVAVGRNLFGYFYPGEYIGALDNFIFYLGYGNEIVSRASPIESPLKYVLTGGENTHGISTIEEFGVICFPMENLFLSNINTRGSNNTDPTIYHSHGRAKMWLAGGHNLEGNVRIGYHSTWLRLDANSLYEHRFSNGFTAGAGLTGTRNDDNGNINIYGGPQLIASVVRNMGGKIKSIENSHLLTIISNREEITNPDIDYAFYIRLRTSPNISIVGEANIFAARMRVVTGSGGIYLHAGF